MTVRESPILTPYDENWFQLGVLLSVSFSLPMLVVGERLAMQYGAGIAICSILMGNLILWLIGITVISMPTEDRFNAIDTIKSYLGKYGTPFMLFVLMASILNWFVLQINATIPSITAYFSDEEKTSLIRLGAGFGFFITLLSLGGIRFIHRATVISFPFVFLYYLFSIYQSDYSIQSIDRFGLSMPAVISTILVLLPGMINLPTVFRHSRSKANSYLGLAMMIILISFFEISSIWMKFTNTWDVIYIGSKYSVYSIATLIFVVLTLILINLINIYYASACWETYVPRFEGAKGYAIIGLMGTACYAILQVYTPIRFIGDLTNCYLASLGIVLLISHLVRILVKHRPRKLEQMLNTFSWLVGCVIATLLMIENQQDSIRPLLTGAGTSVSVFLGIIFIEENIWAIKKLPKAVKDHVH